MIKVDQGSSEGAGSSRATACGTSLVYYAALAAPGQDQIKITDTKVMQVRDPGTLIEVETMSESRASGLAEQAAQSRATSSGCRTRAGYRTWG